MYINFIIFLCDSPRHQQAATTPLVVSCIHALRDNKHQYSEPKMCLLLCFGSVKKVLHCNNFVQKLVYALLLHIGVKQIYALYTWKVVVAKILLPENCVISAPWPQWGAVCSRFQKLCHTFHCSSCIVPLQCPDTEPAGVMCARHYLPSHNRSFFEYLWISTSIIINSQHDRRYWSPRWLSTSRATIYCMKMLITWQWINIHRR